jgi:hypothetical protein
MGFFVYGFWVGFVSGPNESTREDPLGLIFQELFTLMYPKIQQPLMNITSEIFGFNL